MKVNKILFLLLVFTHSVLLYGQKDMGPRVFIFTDINIDSGDPDDRQSLIHLFWYSNELRIEGIVPDRWEAQGYKACELVIEAYQKDYTSYQLNKKDYPEADFLTRLVAKNFTEAETLFKEAASKKDTPLYVLVWGNMKNVASILLKYPHLAHNIRLITIGTGLMLEKDIPYMPPNWEKSNPCKQLNWNGFGRNEIYHATEFQDLWWIEMNWTYAGMFSGEEPKQLFQQLSVFGNLGKHMVAVVKNEPWAQYFRVGDTPSVLYLIDTMHAHDDPTESSWAGKFFRPFPEKKPNYYTDSKGNLEWNYADPCQTWNQHDKIADYAKGTLQSKRGEMYQSLLEKLKSLYNAN